MDPATTTTAAAAGVGTALVCLLRLGYRWIKARAAVRRAEPDQQGLSARIRSLPPGSRLTERTADREVEIVVGAGGE
ncbi:hypothetical protein [Streptomyces sp. NPDC090022]|uniref:hypothetical protein n=1 Tax=Streptomyces sp. NPDC090022 TaxID=3365920 RepID=UPI0037FB76A6